jgi:hypothetical protein
MPESPAQFWASVVHHATRAGDAAGDVIEHGCRYLTTNPVALVGAIVVCIFVFVRAMKS